MDGVAAAEEELDEVGADEAAAAGDANQRLRLHLRRWCYSCCRMRRCNSCVKGVARKTQAVNITQFRFFFF